MNGPKQNKLKLPDYVNTFNQSGESWHISLNLGKAPRPSKTYTAESCQIVQSPNGNFSLSFSDFNYTTAQPNHTLCVVFSDVALLSLWDTCREFTKKVHGYVQAAYGGTPKSMKQMAALNHMVYANLAFIGQRESDIVFAFYNFNPRTARVLSLGDLGKTEPLIDPVVEVQTSVRSALAFFADLEESVTTLSKTFPSLAKIVEAKAQVPPKLTNGSNP